jgi:hypothetical protein
MARQVNKSTIVVLLRLACENLGKPSRLAPHTNIRLAFAGQLFRPIYRGRSTDSLNPTPSGPPRGRRMARSNRWLGAPCLFLPNDSETEHFFSSSLIFLGLTAQAIPLRSGLRVFCFPGSGLNPMGPSHKAAARFGSRSHSLLGAPRKWGKKRRKFSHGLP